MMNADLELMDAQQNVLDMIAGQADLKSLLNAMADWVEALFPGSVAAFMRFDPDRHTLSLLPNPRLSRRYAEQLQNVPLGPEQGAFGTAAYRRKVMLTEIRTAPCWKALRHAAILEGFETCWSSPLITSQGELLGTFETYYRGYMPANETSQKRLRQAAALVTLAFLRDRDTHQHRTLAEWHRSLFDNHPDGVYEFDLKGRFQQGNAALEQITGYPVDEMIGRHFDDFIATDYRELTQAAFDAARSGESRQYETIGIHASGRAYPLEVINFPVTVDGEIVGVYGICHDITRRKRREADLRLLQRGIEASPVGMVMVDAIQTERPIVYANDAFCHLTGYSHDQVLGRNCRFLQGERTDPAAVETIRKALQANTEVQVTLLNYRQDGSTFWNRLTVSPVTDERGQCTHFIGTQEDITQHRDQEAQIAYQATHDLLTGLPNRASLDARLEREYRKSLKRQSPLTVMYLDLDGFKTVNDGLGHPVGNRMLVAVAKRLRQYVAAGDMLARVGGDEFIFLLPHLPHHDAAAEAAKNILEAFESPFDIDGKMLHISTSIGLACRGADTRRAQELLQYADLAMEGAKRQGRNTWQWYQGGGNESTGEYVLMRHDIQMALREGQFELFYQPVVEATTGRIRSVEALIRWHHPLHGMISPGVFIPVAEQTGQIIDIGRWVLREACQTLADSQARGDRVVPVAVNISSLQFHRDGFLDEVKRVLDETGLPPNLLELEMTESILLQNAEKVIDLVTALRAMGISIAIDDFGTGFSSLSYLRDLPIHKIKLDRAFIEDILTSSHNAAIVEGTITMAHHMALTVVAEGIEQSTQQKDLCQRRCDYLQGFFFARPMPWKELQRLPDTLP
ncbi:EAL domain-containing protein [Salinicola sp. MIT1003]|uniref:bifunctional diguanylate cyclase/phosphodiesterase n=1 Tax=Salinicola sp. MIT1003 TaxID=1882734 RepID=UPI000AB9C32E|nr:EAL domain-containing protein [Salinicola sp. MIT1003]